MKRGLIIVVACAFLFALPVLSRAADLTFRNEEQCDAKVALAYQRGGLDIVEGWYNLKPGQELTVHLYEVNANDVFAHVVYEYPQWKPPADGDAPPREAHVQDTHFRYAGKPEDDPAMYRAAFVRAASLGGGSAASGKAGGRRNLVLVLKALSSVRTMGTTPRSSPPEKKSQ